MRKIMGYLGLGMALYLLGGAPNCFDAFYLRYVASPESVLTRFYTERDLGEDQLEDSLILAGPKMAPLLAREIVKKDIPRRRYAIGALGSVGDYASIQALEQILQDKRELDYFRADALAAIAHINLAYAQELAKEYQEDTGYLAQCADMIRTKPEWMSERTWAAALAHRHD